MPALTLDAFVTRHRFQHARVDALAAAPNADLAALRVSVDLDGNGDLAGDAELTALYGKLLALEPTGTTSLVDSGRSGQAYSALRTLLRARVGAEPALGSRRLADVAELAGVFAGAATLTRGTGEKTFGTGSVQDALIELGFAVDLGASAVNRGIFGGRTETAVKAFQSSAGLGQSGVIDEPTLRALSARLDAARAPVVTPPPVPGANPRFAHAAFTAIRTAGATLASGAQGDAVRALQQALLDMGFSVKTWTGSSGAQVGGVDGGFGAQTDNALRNFQAHARARFPAVRVTGALDKATLEALDALAPAPGATSWQTGSANHAPAPYWSGDAAKRVRVVVVRDQHRTFLFDANGKIDKVFSNAHGAPGTDTHAGLKVVNAKLDETAAKATGVTLWSDPKAFGTRILGLSWADRTPTNSGEELHGTYARKDMGKSVSHGCVRHYNEDVEEMFAKLSVGDRVAVVDTIDDPRLKMPAGQPLPAIV